MASKKFPQRIFVSWKDDSDGTAWLSADAQAAREIEDDGPSRVATYKLVEINELSKRVVSKPVR